MGATGLPAVLTSLGKGSASESTNGSRGSDLSFTLSLNLGSTGSTKALSEVSLRDKNTGE
jgi:hypothetical protein